MLARPVGIRRAGRYDSTPPPYGLGHAGLTATPLRCYGGGFVRLVAFIHVYFPFTQPGVGPGRLVRQQLLPRLAAAGLRVSVVKHSHHAVEFDTPGKDSYRHRAAGAAQVMLLGDRGAAVYEDLAAPLDLAAQLARLQPADLVILEGQKWLPVPKLEVKWLPVPKLEVHRPALGKSLLQPDDPDILAVASDAALPALAVPQLDLNDIDAIAAFVLRWREQQA